MGAYEMGAVIYVTPLGGGTGSGTFANATTLTNALAGALNGNNIWVQGAINGVGEVYSPSASANVNASFAMLFGVNLYGGFFGNETTLGARNVDLYPTTLSGAVSGSCNVVIGASNSRLDGFIVTGGNATGAGTGAYSNSGGGLLCNGTSPVVYGCVFTGNAASYGGAGSYIVNASSPTFTNCVFSGNTTPAWGGGVAVEFNATASFINCTFSGNTSTNSDGGALETFGGGAATFLNSILWGDTLAGQTQPEILVFAGSTAAFSYCDVEGSLNGGIDNGNNIYTDPLFLNPASPTGVDGLWMGADDGLMPGGLSPAINGGASVINGAAPNDILHTNRPQGTAPDIGAYETPFVTVTATIPNGVKPALSLGSPTNGQFTVTRLGINFSQPLTVYFTTAGSTATPGTVSPADYLSIGSSVVIPAGSATVTVPVTVIASSQAENQVAVNLTVTPGVPGAGCVNAYAVVAAASTATVTITNLNTPGVVLVPVGPFTPSGLPNVLSTNQGGTSATFNIHLNSQPTTNVTVNLASSNTAEGTISATSLTFTPTTGQLPSGSTSGWNVAQTVTVNGVNDYIAHGPQPYEILTSVATNISDPFYNRNTTSVLAAQQSVFPTTMPYVAPTGNNWVVKVNGVVRSSGYTVTGPAGGVATITFTSSPPQAGDTVQIQYFAEQTFTGGGGATSFQTSFPFVLDSGGLNANSWLVSVNSGVGAVFQSIGASGYTVSNGTGANLGLAVITFTTAPGAGATVLVQAPDVVAAINNNTRLKGLAISPTTVSVTEERSDRQLHGGAEQPAERRRQRGDQPGQRQPQRQPLDQCLHPDLHPDLEPDRLGHDLGLECLPGQSPWRPRATSSSTPAIPTPARSPRTSVLRAPTTRAGSPTAWSRSTSPMSTRPGSSARRHRAW